MTTSALTDPNTWVDRYGGVLFGYAMARLRNATQAEEAVQETLVAALQARDRFSGRSTEQTWLVGILKHKIVDQIRKASRERPLNAEEAPDAAFEDGHWRESTVPKDWGPDAREAVERREFQAALARCLARLPARIAAAFTLRELEDLDTVEICKVLGVTATNLWVMLHRARSQLRRCLEAQWLEGAR